MQVISEMYSFKSVSWISTEETKPMSPVWG